MTLPPCCREFDPIEDTESPKLCYGVDFVGEVAESSIRLRILKAKPTPCFSQPSPTVAESSIRLRILKGLCVLSWWAPCCGCREFDPIEDTERDLAPLGVVAAPVLQRVRSD